MSEIPLPDPPLRDGTILLRPWSRGDVDWIASACNDLSIARWSPAIPFPYAASDAIGWLADQEPSRLSGRALDLAVTDAETGERLGAIGLGRVDPAMGTATVGYWLATDARGRGSITAALRLLAAWALGELGLARLELLTDPENLTSQRVAERCGFRREGHLRSHIVIRHSGERRDSLVYGLLSGELTRR